MPGENEQEALGTLLSQLISQVSTLAEREIEFARVEMSQKVAQVSRGARTIVVGGAVAYAGFLAIVATAILALVQYAALPWWAASLAIGAFVSITGLLVMMAGSRALKIQRLVPQKTLQLLKDDADWARQRANR
jgi:hypothetical protein